MGLFDGDPNKSHSPFDPSSRSAGGFGHLGGGMPEWPIDGTPDVDTHASSTPNIDNVGLDSFPKFGQCMKAIRDLEAAQLLIAIIRDQIDTFCGEYGDEELCSAAQANLRRAQADLNAARQTIAQACVKAI